MNIKNKPWLIIIFLILAFLTYMKIDYRFIETFNCCQDDHDYLMHAETIALDFDLDYSNQLKGFEEMRFNNDGKIAPKGFIGSGLLASPFLFVGNIFENIFEGGKNNTSAIFNFKILFYSLSAVFYFFVGINLLTKVAYELKIKIHPLSSLLIISGTGLIYYAFERYSMTHVYEFFTSALIIYLSHKYFSTNLNYYALLIPITMFLSLSVRWVNYFVVLLPFILYSLFKSSYKDLNLVRNQYFIFSFFGSLIFFLYTNYVIYGKITFNPQFVYETEKMASGFLTGHNNFFHFLSDNISNLITIFFTQEFGIILFSPLIFFASIYCVFLIFNNSLNISSKFILVLSFALIYAPVLLWKSTASSYGFRYLLSSVALCFILYSHYSKNYQNQTISFLINFLSVFSVLSVLFFETSPETSLSLTEATNSFGRELRFTQPNYLSGYLDSLFSFQSYLKIFSTSFLGALIFKSILSFLSIDEFNSLLSKYNLPTNNEDFQNLLTNLDSISFSKILIFLLFLISVSLYIEKKLQRNEQI